MVDERDTDSDNLVQVAVPRHLLPAVYRVLADAMAPTPLGHTMTNSPMRVETPAVNRNLIDLIMDVATQIGADRRPVSLTELYNAYRQAYPGIGKGNARGSFDATVNYHCINMRSRFPDASDRRKPAYWLARPTFKRVARGRYMLLSDDEIRRFQRSVAEDSPMVYADDYDVADLAPKG